MPGGLAGQLVDTFIADELGKLGVGVNVVERPLVSLEHRFKQARVAELAGQNQIFRVSGDCRHIGEHLVRPAVLGAP